MGGILNLLKKIEAFDPATVAVKAITQTKESITQYNRDQMFAGLNKDGSEILPAYSELTIHLKELKGPDVPTDRVTLYDEGNFYNKMRTEVKGGIVFTDSTDEKTAKLKKKYNKSKGGIFGIGGEYKKGYITNNLKPVWNKSVEAATGLKMK